MAAFARFDATFGNQAVGPPDVAPWLDSRLVAVDGYAEFAARYAGWTFGGGLYRVLDSRSGPLMAELLAEAFPALTGDSVPFAVDWLGRLFTLSGSHSDVVLLFEPGTGEVLEIPATFSTFHDSELVDDHDAALASGFFAEWCAGHGDGIPLTINDCVGYRVPLFLGGKDEVENLSVVDLSVYWSIIGQLMRGAATLPEGGSIRDVRMR